MRTIRIFIYGFMFWALAMLATSCSKEEVTPICDITNQEVLYWGLSNTGQGVANRLNWSVRHSSDSNKRIFYWSEVGTLEVTLYECYPVGAKLTTNWGDTVISR